jgi:hypothetical protein
MAAAGREHSRLVILRAEFQELCQAAARQKAFLISSRSSKNGNAGIIHATHPQDMNADELCNAQKGGPMCVPLNEEGLSGFHPRSAPIYRGLNSA